jgi:hypothetical protein
VSSTAAALDQCYLLLSLAWSDARLGPVVDVHAVKRSRTQNDAVVSGLAASANDDKHVRSTYLGTLRQSAGNGRWEEV